MARAGDETRQRLIEATVRALAEEGIVGTSARVIASRAEVNQALIFYHFGSVEGLLVEASRQVSADRADVYAEKMSSVTSLAELAVVARGLHAEERRSGNLTVLAQLLAGSRTHPALAAALEENFDLLASQVEDTLVRLLKGSVFAELIPPSDLARTISASFLGLELLDTVTTSEQHDTFATLEVLSALGDALLQAGAIEASIIRRRLNTSRRQPAT